jgi:chemotaxis protein CheC
VMFIYIDFLVRRRNIEGYIAMMMDLPSLTALQSLLQDLIRRTGGPVSG